MHRQTSSLSKRLFTFVTALGLFASVAGCGGCREPAVVDAPASALDVKVSVLDVSENPSDDKVIAVMQFLQNGKVVRIASNASASCNGVALTYNGLLFGYAERVPLLPPGSTYVFRYGRSGVNTDLGVTAPPRPVFAPPTIAGAILARTNNLTIRYVAGSGTGVRGGAGDGTNSKNDTQPDDGTHDGLDVSGFTAGAGTLSITRILEGPISGSGFHSATQTYETNKTIAITWQ